MTRLLIVVNNPAYFLSHRLPVGRAAREAGMEVHVAAPRVTFPSDGLSPPEAVARIEEEGLAYHEVPIYRARLNPVYDLRTLLRLIALYRRVEPDLVHLVTYKAIALGGLAARVAGVPAVVSAVPGFGHVFTEEGAAGRVYRWLMAVGYRAAFGHPNQVAILQNREGLELLVRRGLLKEDNAELIRGSGVDPERFGPAPEPEGPPLVVLAARMLWTKGADTFVEAARILEERGTRARFALVGDTDPGNRAAIPRGQLQAWAEEGPVEWWRYREDMPEVFRRAAVVCLPSRYGEGVPKVLLEAAAAGRPMVATDIPGSREVVREGETGLLVPKEDSEALAKALSRLLEDRDLRRSMGRRARRLAVEEFTADAVARRHLEVYRRALDRVPRS